MLQFSRYVLFVVLLCGVGNIFATADTVCHVTIDGNILALDGKTIKIPLSMVGIAPDIGYEAPDVTAVNAQRATPSIVFVIDDSGSMMQNDKDANRYSVTKEILDEIYSKEPNTRVAVVTFRNWLAWDWRENSLFRRISSPFGWNDSYFPLTPLDSVFTDGKRGIDKIKGLFELDQWNLLQAFHSDSTERTRPQQRDADGNPIPSTQSNQGTDITLAFTAAKDALRESTTPAERQFIVFLSDGFHGGVDVEMESKKLDYQDGEDVPTTYTIFLGDSVKTPPQQLLTMIDNIRSNGYSTANPRSELWSIESSHDTLLALMQREILSQVYAPLKMASHAQTGGRSAVTISESNLRFPKPIALNPDTTVLELELTFPLEGSDKKTRDTVITSSVTFIRDDGISEIDNSNLDEQCFLRDMSLSSNGFPITTAIRNAQTSLTALFTLEGIGDASEAFVYAVPANDSLEMALDPDGDAFEGTFGRKLSEEPVDGDDIIQHDAGDSIRIVWRNPDLPLDTISRQYRVTPYDPVEITAVRYRDTDRDGRIDVVIVETDRSINEEEFDNLDAERLKLPAERQLTIDSIGRVKDDEGFIIHVTQKENAPIKTGLTPKDSLTVTEYEIGPFADYIEKGKYPIVDAVAPVLISAEFIPAKGGDTLVVTFSEPVSEITSSHPFKLETGGGESYSMRLELIDKDSLNTKLIFRVISTTAPDGRSLPGDSIWIAASAEVSDTLENVQVEPNRKIALSIRVPEIAFRVGALRNPVDRSKNTRFEVEGWGTVKGGTLIALVPDFPANDITKVVEKLHIRIYDAVGNLLAYDPDNKPFENRWYIHWDGTNRNKRNVGPGVYCAVITITAIDGDRRPEIVENVKIAFK